MYVRQVVTSSQQAGQYVSQWSDFWQHVATRHPVGFIFICTVGMGLVACGLLFGLLTNLTCGMGSLLALCFWSTQLVSLMPIGVQASDIGMLLVFLLVFLGFIISHAGQMFGADRILTNSMGYWACLASGRRDIYKRYPKTSNPILDAEQVQWQKVEFPTEMPNAAGIETPILQYPTADRNPNVISPAPALDIIRRKTEKVN
jgi:hypothetical protein